MGTKRDPKPHGRVIRGSASTSAEGPMRKRTTAVAHKKHKSKQPAAIGAIGWTIRSVFKVITAVLLICIIAGCIGATALTVFVMRYVDSESGYDLYNMETTYTSKLYAQDESGDYEVVRSMSSNGRREWLEADEIPEVLQHAMICAEDERYYEHEGVDWLRTFAAFGNMAVQIVTGSETEFFTGGASTITQQLIKNINQDFYNRTPAVKCKEILAALNLEKNYTKEEILCCYMNYITLGNSNYGVEAGAEYYFGKTVDELSIVEMASLVAITKSPGEYNPIDAPEDNKERRDWVLDKMLEYNYITQEEHDEAVSVEELKTVDHSSSSDEEEEDIFSWMEDAIIQEVVADLQEEYEWDYSTALNKVMGGGLQIYSSMDQELQDELEKQFEDDYNFNSWIPEDHPDAAMVICDYNGYVKAMVGSRDEKTVNLGFNTCTQGNLNMGSCMKPITVYAPALEKDLIYWSQTRVDEAKLDLDGDGRKEWPQNYGRYYSGNVSIIQALTQSLNTIPVDLMMELGVTETLQWLENEMGLTTIDEGQDSYATVLGSNTYGCYLDEFTAAFTCFGNNGHHTDAKYYTRVEDASGKVLLEAEAKNRQIMGADTAYIMNRMLRNVVTSGTGTEAAMEGLGIEVCGKTGTTELSQRSFVGLTPYYVSTIWYGYIDDTSKPYDSSTVYSPALIWYNIMSGIFKADSERYPSAKFELDDSGVEYISGGYYKKDFDTSQIFSSSTSNVSKVTDIETDISEVSEESSEPESEEESTPSSEPSTPSSEPASEPTTEPPSTPEEPIDPPDSGDTSEEEQPPVVG